MSKRSPKSLEQHLNVLEMVPLPFQINFQGFSWHKSRLLYQKVNILLLEYRKQFDFYFDSQEC
jgi:hypothetical protein